MVESVCAYTLNWPFHPIELRAGWGIVISSINRNIEAIAKARHWVLIRPYMVVTSGMQGSRSSPVVAIIRCNLCSVRVSSRQPAGFDSFFPSLAFDSCRIHLSDGIEKLRNCVLRLYSATQEILQTR
jgi:hypothetical protein